MSKINNGELDQYGAEPFEQQQFGQLALKGLSSICRLSALIAGIMMSAKLSL